MTEIKQKCGQWENIHMMEMAYRANYRVKLWTREY